MQLKNPEIRFEVTNLCNASCICCPREKMTRKQGVMDKILYKRVLDEAFELGAKNVCLENYGESFLDPYIFERAEYAKAKKMKVYTVTNGSLLDEEKREKIIKYFDHIRISMFGMTKNTFERIHRKLSYDIVKENVLNLFEERNKQKNSNLRIDMYFLLMQENKHEVKDFIEFFKNKADDILVWKPHNWADGRNYRKMKNEKKSCGRPFSGPIQIQWNGLVVPCCFDYNSRIVLADLNKQSLIAAIKGEKYENFRNAHATHAFYKYPLCNNCDQLNKRDDVLVYSTAKATKVGSINNTGFTLSDS